MKMLVIRKNPDAKKYQQMTEAVKKNNGYCPCLVERNEDAKCICKPFREQKTEGLCLCGRFIKVEKPTVELSEETKDRIFQENVNGKMTNVRNHNVGKSDYAKHNIQPWDIWIEYKLNPFDADIVKRILRIKDEPGMSKQESRKLDYEKIIHICQERIRQIDSGIEL